MLYLLNDFNDYEKVIFKAEIVLFLSLVRYSTVINIGLSDFSLYKRILSELLNCDIWTLEEE